MFARSRVGLWRWGGRIGGVTLNTDRNVDVFDTVKRVATFLRSQVPNKR
jgi:hypothetical protein